MLLQIQIVFWISGAIVTFCRQRGRTVAHLWQAIGTDGGLCAGMCLRNVTVFVRILRIERLYSEKRTDMERKAVGRGDMKYGIWKIRRAITSEQTPVIPGCTPLLAAVLEQRGLCREPARTQYLYGGIASYAQEQIDTEIRIVRAGEG